MNTDLWTNKTSLVCKIPCQKSAIWSHDPVCLCSGRTASKPRTRAIGLEACEINDGLDEDGVVTYVRVLALKLGEWAEERTAAGDVHLTHGPLEGGGSDIGTEGIDDVLPVALVQEHKGYLQEGETAEQEGYWVRKRLFCVLQCTKSPS